MGSAADARSITIGAVFQVSKVLYGRNNDGITARQDDEEQIIAGYKTALYCSIVYL